MPTPRAAKDFRFDLWIDGVKIQNVTWSAPPPAAPNRKARRADAARERRELASKRTR